MSLQQQRLTAGRLSRLEARPEFAQRPLCMPCCPFKLAGHRPSCKSSPYDAASMAWHQMTQMSMSCLAVQVSFHLQQHKFPDPHCIVTQYGQQAAAYLILISGSRISNRS